MTLGDVTQGKIWKCICYVLPSANGLRPIAPPFGYASVPGRGPLAFWEELYRFGKGRFSFVQPAECLQCVTPADEYLGCVEEAVPQHLPEIQSTLPVPALTGLAGTLALLFQKVQPRTPALRSVLSPSRYPAPVQLAIVRPGIGCHRLPTAAQIASERQGRGNDSFESALGLSNLQFLVAATAAYRHRCTRLSFCSMPW